MGQGSICQKISRLIEPVLQAENFELVDVEYKKEGRSWILRVFIDKVSGVTLDDCQNVNRQIEDLIEVQDLIRRKHILEVSSPGLDRPLKRESDFLRNKNRRIQLATLSPIQDRKRFSGIIKGIRDKNLVLETDGTIVSVPLKVIAKAKLEVQFS